MAKLGRPLAMSVEQRRAEIFTAAERLFGEKGFENVTMAEIASAVGMSKKTLYVHFSDKRSVLKSLVASSYIWAEDAFDEQIADAKTRLILRLKTIAKHVLSQRHIQLCRLAIAERVGMDEGLTDTFYEMGISTSRNHLIQAIQALQKTQCSIALSPDIFADLLFGACIAKPFIDLLLIDREVDFKQIDRSIEQTVDAMFPK